MSSVYRDPKNRMHHRLIAVVADQYPSIIDNNGSVDPEVDHAIGKLVEAISLANTQVRLPQTHRSSA